MAQHPKLMFSNVKEPGYFLGRGAGLFLNGAGDMRRHGRIRLTQADYLALFQTVRAGQLAGEASSNYFYDAKAAEAIRALIPAVRLIFILRSPEERALSAYRHLRRDGDEQLELPEALQAEARRTRDGYDYLWRYTFCGAYSMHLRPWLEYFSKEQVFICYFEDLLEQPGKLLERISRFLEIEPPAGPVLPVHENASHDGMHAVREFIAKTPIGHAWRLLPLPIRLRVRYALRPGPAHSESTPCLETLRGYFANERSQLRLLLEANGFPLPRWID
jgi:hypothetical protein